jgi:hypothetical protein
VSEDSASLLPSELSNHKENVSLSFPDTRFHEFFDLYEFVKGGVGSKRPVPSRGIRNTSWKNLFQLAKSAEQLEKVVELFPRWREMQRSFDMKDSEIFVRAYLSSRILAVFSS